MNQRIRYFLDFEKPIEELEKKIQELKKLTQIEKINLTDEINNLQIKLEKLREDTFFHLTPWQRVQLARHPDRPKTLSF